MVEVTGEEVKSLDSSVGVMGSGRIGDERFCGDHY